MAQLAKNFDEEAPGKIECAIVSQYDCEKSSLPIYVLHVVSHCAQHRLADTIDYSKENFPGHSPSGLCTFKVAHHQGFNLFNHIQDSYTITAVQLETPKE